ncbi:MAG: DUF1015 domain-containing protein [Myxococcaceae bacterium]|nr:DUF1015 domain-containing protein [Myxococcaceae bacterium]
MARVLPFRALLHTSEAGQEWLWHAHLPLSDADRRAWAEEPHHGIHLAKAIDPRARLVDWMASGVLRRENRPAFHLLEVASARPEEGPVRFVLGALHPEEGLEALEEATRDTSAPWVEPTAALAADDDGALRALLADAAERAPIVAMGVLDERPWRLLRLTASPSTRRIQALLQERPLRPLSAVRGSAPHLVAVLPLSESGWRFRPIHRAIQGLETFQPERFLQLVNAYARVFPVDAPMTSQEGLAEARERLASVPAGYHAVLAVLPEGRGHLLRFRQGLDLSHLPAAPRNPTLRSLDLALLNALVLRTVLGLKEPGAPGHPNVFTVSSLEQLVDQVRLGIFQAGFALNPPPAWEVRAVMEARAKLPPRTLRLAPEPPAGLLFLDPEL